MPPTEVHLNAEMADIVSAALTAGVGGSTEDVVLLALRTLWSGQLTSTAQDEMQSMLREAVEDTRPGEPLDVVFARLTRLAEQGLPATRADAA